MPTKRFATARGAAVRAAREAGDSWLSIGVTRQAAQKRFGR